MKNIFLIIILVILFILINTPKNSFIINGNETLQCHCIGYLKSNSIQEKKCYGLTYACIGLSSSDYIQIQSKKPDFCGNMTCSDTKTYLGLGQPEAFNQMEKAKKSGVNFIFIIDTSFSMEGSNIENTKESVIKLIDGLPPDDLAAIIAFNTHATNIHDFSHDKESLVTSIKNITVEEDTRYGPALELAEKMFSELQDSGKRDFIIFLSDGYPLDSRENIINISDSLKKKGIEIYTIRVSEKNVDTKYDILNDIASPLGENGLRGFFVSVEGQSLYDSFKEIYDTVVEKDFYFKVTDNFNKKTYHPYEKLYFDYNIASIDDANAIPGYYIDQDKILCVRNANATIIISDASGFKRDVPLKYLSGSYVGESEGLKPGNYSYFINISLDAGDSPDCQFHDLQNLGTLTVKSKEPQAECEVSSCVDVENAVTDTQIFQKDNSIRNGLRNKRLLVAIDTSESMRFDNIQKTKDAMEYLINLFSKNFDIALIDFNQDAKLIQPFTSDSDLLKNKLNEIKVGGTTEYSPVFKKANYIYQDNDGYGNYMLFISDGVNWDEVSSSLVIDQVKELSKKGVCIFTMDYSFSDKGQESLRKISEISQEYTGCSGNEMVSLAELKDYFIRLYDKLKSGKGELHIDLEVSGQNLTLGQPLYINARVFSEYNNREFPSALSLDESMKAVGKENFCFPQANMTIKIFDEDKKLIHTGKMNYNPDTGYSYIVSAMDEGSYDALLIANITKDENCDVYGERKFRFSYHNVESTPEQSNLLLLLAIDLLIILLIVYLIIKKD